MSTTPNKLTIESLFLFLRHRLLLARTQKNEAELRTLSGVFDLLYDAAVEVNDGTLIGLSEDFECAVRDSLMDAEWKSEILLTEDELKRLLSDHS